MLGLVIPTLHYEEEPTAANKSREMFDGERKHFYLHNLPQATLVNVNASEH